MQESPSTWGSQRVWTEDSVLLQRCREGDEAAMATVIAKHRRRVIRIAANSLRDTHEAEDVAQEAFLKAFKELGKLRDDRAFASYLYRICVRLCLDRLRSRRAEPAVIERVQASDGPRVETKVLLEKLLQQLSPELRMTLVLREVEQLSYEEVATALNVPLGTVRSRLHTAREKFRALYFEATGE
ncbi:MAG: sigma-70 family RNA polymerase sigma factor [Fimbriimonadaceae bacterium]|nr:sigma-70 family RNA polymerase sigma factor [Fimbriimonadaceae bacterium]QYK55337.1 MAG: sigma-70 family RNA polymerase sigma factor [Fimbriimonadaceae bacterium]